MPLIEGARIGTPLISEPRLAAILAPAIVLIKVLPSWTVESRRVGMLWSRSAMAI